MHRLDTTNSNFISKLDSDPLVDERTVRRQLGGISKPTLYDRIRRGSVPRPLKIGQLSRWRQSWIEEIVAEAERVWEAAQ